MLNRCPLSCRPMLRASSPSDIHRCAWTPPIGTRGLCARALLRPCGAPCPRRLRSPPPPRSHPFRVHQKWCSILDPLRVTGSGLDTNLITARSGTPCRRGCDPGDTRVSRPPHTRDVHERQRRCPRCQGQEPAGRTGQSKQDPEAYIPAKDTLCLSPGAPVPPAPTARPCRTASVAACPRDQKLAAKEHKGWGVGEYS